MAQFKVRKSFVVYSGYDNEVQTFRSEGEATAYAATLNDAYNLGRNSGIAESRKNPELKPENDY